MVGVWFVYMVNTINRATGNIEIQPESLDMAEEVTDGICVEIGADVR
eukprot:CAMPEP_0118676160 /NCGR_PEP_ID=MMETSP0800-20121206/1883_1 /TAXON_ID=210618 ORGANISM="Striatella unipunctata, Strain CCMP2910" /NCGR_SAMPLE_ID=MMETSP0800 /ASSEMBLY_ACC=CAM_ASM_000638 /LENGTH=46 /DNA_ID= /DNA_START= /DNA_END= /DNA_ORIENTATION=